ncbi:hypothetical protein KUTeg_009114 [Tegillarca granosa]|uniref:Uncharacterized protein n=1 Tax=Tegillarca granosa TaxID=220873 RepID=A0ABQ9F7G3_TEGGR|nr:hypothetical protein KUTeg_009114 [Tegillarca granosa]
MAKKILFSLMLMAILFNMLTDVEGTCESDIEATRVKLKGYLDTTITSLKSRQSTVTFRVGRLRSGVRLHKGCYYKNRADSYTLNNKEFVTELYQLDNIGVVRMRSCLAGSYW